jgi:hypothetical protein
MIPFARDNPIFGKMIVENCPIVVEASGTDFIGTDIDYSVIPDCSDTFFVSTNTDQGKGCCKMTSPDQTCKGLTNDDYHNMGLKILNPENNNLNEICFSNPFLKKLPKIDNFVELVTVSVLTFISSMFIGVCLEFWLRYGESKHCIYYQSKCKNIGDPKDNGIVSLVDYFFPDNIEYYPYQACNKPISSMKHGGLKVKNNVGKMKGGGDIISKFRDQGAKCVTIDDNKKETTTKPFPYNIAEFAHNNIDNDLLKMPFKSFSFFFLFTILGIRYVFNNMFKKLSLFYQKNVKDNAILSNIIFLLITGIIFPIFSFYFKMPDLKYGATYILIILFGILSVVFSFSFLASYVIIFLELSEKSSMIKKHLSDYDNDYYNIFYFNSWLAEFIENPRLKDESSGSKFLMFLKALIFDLIGFIFLIVISVFSLFFISVVAAVIVIIYMNMSLLFNIFYIPLSNFPEMLEIIKSHGSLLTVLFCFSIILASKSTLNDTTTAIMSGILGIIVIYKLITNIKKK